MLDSGNSLHTAIRTRESLVAIEKIITDLQKALQEKYEPARANKALKLFINQGDKFGKTPLHYVSSLLGSEDEIQNQELRCSELLFKYGAKADAVDKAGNTPIHDFMADARNVLADAVPGIMKVEDVELTKRELMVQMLNNGKQKQVLAFMELYASQGCNPVKPNNAGEKALDFLISKEDQRKVMAIYNKSQGVHEEDHKASKSGAHAGKILAEREQEKNGCCIIL